MIRIEEGRNDKQGSPVANKFYGQITAKKTDTRTCLFARKDAKGLSRSFPGLCGILYILYNKPKLCPRIFASIYVFSMRIFFFPVEKFRPSSIVIMLSYTQFDIESSANKQGYDNSQLLGSHHSQDCSSEKKFLILIPTCSSYELSNKFF